MSWLEGDVVGNGRGEGPWRGGHGARRRSVTLPWRRGVFIFLFVSAYYQRTLNRVDARGSRSGLRGDVTSTQAFSPRRRDQYVVRRYCLSRYERPQ